MNRITPYILFLAGFVFLGMIYLDRDGYSKVKDLRNSLKNQEQINYALIKEIRDYKREIRGIQNSDRELEKIVRDKYALSKDNETIIIFKNKK